MRLTEISGVTAASLSAALLVAILGIIQRSLSRRTNGYQPASREEIGDHTCCSVIARLTTGGSNARLLCRNGLRSPKALAVPLRAVQLALGFRIDFGALAVRVIRRRDQAGTADTSAFPLLRFPAVP